MEESIIKEIEADENKERKKVSFQQSEIYAGRLKQYVDTYIASRYSAESLKEMPVISSINISKRMVDKRASLYNKPPKRTFKNASPQVQEVLNMIYKDMNVNIHMKQANRMFVAQEQHIMQVIPFNGRITLRNFKMHNIDAIENPDNPEKAMAYITSSFDRDYYQKQSQTDTGLINEQTNYRDGRNSRLADKDDFKRAKRYVYWSADSNYIIDGMGERLSEDTINNLGVLNFIDFSLFKDNEFFVRPSGDLYDFTIQLNAALSSLWQIIDMQGFSVGYYIGPRDTLPSTLTISPAKIVVIPTSQEDTREPKFGFTSPSPDLAGSKEFIDTFLSLFLTSRGMDTKTVNTRGEAEQYTSGLDRLLAKIERFEASEDDIFVMEKGEKELFELIKRIVNNTANTNLLDAKYSITIPEDVYLEIEYAKPEIINTEKDMVDLFITKIENGLMSRREAIKELYKLDNNDEIDKKIEEIDLEKTPVESLASIPDIVDVEDIEEKEEMNEEVDI